MSYKGEKVKDNPPVFLCYKCTHCNKIMLYAQRNSHNIREFTAAVNRGEIFKKEYRMNPVCSCGQRPSWNPFKHTIHIPLILDCFMGLGLAIGCFTMIHSLIGFVSVLLRTGNPIFAFKLIFGDLFYLLVHFDIWVFSVFAWFVVFSSVIKIAIGRYNDYMIAKELALIKEIKDTSDFPNAAISPGKALEGWYKRHPEKELTDDVWKKIETMDKDFQKS